MNPQQQRNYRIATLAAQRAGIKDPRIFDKQMGAEANFTDETSPAGAQGPAQLMPATARSLGVTNPHDPQQAYTAAAHLMAQYLHQYGGSWSKALQAYNAGPGNVGKPLYTETRNYINRILGGPDIIDNPTGGGGPPQVTPIKGAMSLTVDDPKLERQKFFAQWFAQRNPTSPLVKLGVLDPNMQTHARESLPYTKGFNVQAAPGTSDIPTRVSALPAANGLTFPLAQHGKIIGLPYQGTHTMYGNWQSDNAIDIAVPKGTPVVAVSNGVIGDQIGPLDTHGDPHLMGQRVYVQASNNQWYYAHLSRIVVHPGQRVHKGEIIGYSGEANGVQHLHIASQHGSPVHEFVH